MVKLFWTGGFDSTFRLLQLLSSGTPVQPVYLLARIDGRVNQLQELQSMSRVCAVLRDRFGDALLNEVEVVHRVVRDAWVFEQAKRIGYGASYRYPMGYQYVALCCYAESSDEPVEIGVEIGGRAERLLRNWVIGTGGDCRLDLERLEAGREPLAIFRNLRFPLLHLTKEQMLSEAEAQGYAELLLTQTWSCWYPREDGSACGRCEMCHRRPA